MLFDDKLANWIKGGGEVDLPRDPNNWSKLSYRSISWDSVSESWVYVTRFAGCIPPVKVHSRSKKLSELVLVTNATHKIDDKVTTEL